MPHAVEAGKRYVPDVVGSTPTAAPCARFHAAKANGPQKPHHFTGSPERRANAQPRKRYWRSGKTGCVWAPRSDVSQTGPQMPCQVAAEEAKTFRGGVSSRQRQSTFDHSPVSFSCRGDAGGTCRRGVVAAPLPSKQMGPVRVRSAAPDRSHFCGSDGQLRCVRFAGGTSSPAGPLRPPGGVIYICGGPKRKGAGVYHGNAEPVERGHLPAPWAEAGVRRGDSIRHPCRAHGLRGCGISPASRL